MITGIDAGNTNLTEDEERQILNALCSEREQQMSEQQARGILNIGKAAFNHLVQQGTVSPQQVINDLSHQLTGESSTSSLNSSKPNSKLHLEIRTDCNLVFVDSHGNEYQLNMPVLSHVVYLVYLRHPEGIAFKELMDYRDELMDFYTLLSARDPLSENIDRLIDPTNNSLNEKVSRSRQAIVSLLGDNAVPFIITGSKGERRRIPAAADPAAIVWSRQSYTE